MKIYSLIFGLLLTILGSFSTIGILVGAMHQLAVALPAFLIAYVLLNEALRKEKPKGHSLNR